MKLEQKESALMRETHRKRVFLGLSGALFFVTIIQLLLMAGLIRYAHKEHEVHFIPPAVSEGFSLSSSGVSESYLHDMTLFLVQLRFNVTPSSGNYQFNTLLRYVAPSLYGVLRAQLVNEVEQMKKEHLSSAFYCSAIEINTQQLQVKVAGQMKRFVGAEQMSELKETYLFHFSYEQGLLKITNIEKV